MKDLFAARAPIPDSACVVPKLFGHSAVPKAMATRLVVGKSSAPDVRSAVKEATKEALLGASEPVFALVLSTDQYDADVLASSVTAALGDIPWAGCSTAGVFAGDALLTQGIVVGIISSSDIRVGVGVGGPVSADGRTAGRTAVANALGALPAAAPGNHRALILLADVLTGNAVDVVRGAAAEAGTGIAWAGGGAGDNLRFVRTVQYASGKAFRDHVVAIAIDAARPIGAGIRHGWRPYGPPATVTKAEGAVVLELDYEQAFEVYRRTAELRGDRVTPEIFASFSMLHPFGIPQADGEHVIRDPLSVDADGAIRFIAEVSDGSLIRAMEGNRDLLIAAATAAAQDAREAVQGGLAGAFVFDCVSRSLMLKEGICEEFAAFQRALGSGVPMMGCLTFGEIGALGTGVPQFHNKTAVLLALPSGQVP